MTALAVILRLVSGDPDPQITAMPINFQSLEECEAVAKVRNNRESTVQTDHRGRVILKETYECMMVPNMLIEEAADQIKMSGGF